MVKSYRLSWYVFLVNLPIESVLCVLAHLPGTPRLFIAGKSASIEGLLPVIIDIPWDVPLCNCLYWIRKYGFVGPFCRILESNLYSAPFYPFLGFHRLRFMCQITKRNCYTFIGISSR